MPTNPNIIQAQPIRSPTNYLSDILSIKSAKQANEANALKLDAYKSDRARQNKLLEVLGSLPQGATDDDRIGALRNNGYLDEADKVQKGIVERKNADSQAAEREAAARNKDVETIGKRLDIAGSAFRHVMQNPTLETAHSVLDYLGSNGIYTPEQVAQYKQQVATDPASIPRLAETAFRSALSAKEQLLSNATRNTGGKTDTITVDPVSGATKVRNSVVNTQSPDNIASNARMAAEGAANRGVQIRGQNLTDARSRDANDISKTLTTEKKQLEVDALKRGKDASISAAANQIAVIDKALKHPGRSTATGLSGALDPRNFVPGTDATDFRAVLDQIGGSAFLQAFEILKGGGAITEVEGKRATDAIARLSRAQSDEEFVTSLNDLRKVMTDGYKRLSGADYGGESSGPKPGTVENGYRFKGGNAGDPKNWEKV